MNLFYKIKKQNAIRLWVKTNQNVCIIQLIISSPFFLMYTHNFDLLVLWSVFSSTPSRDILFMPRLCLFFIIIQIFILLWYFQPPKQSEKPLVPFSHLPLQCCKPLIWEDYRIPWGKEQKPTIQLNMISWKTALYVPTSEAMLSQKSLSFSFLAHTWHVSKGRKSKFWTHQKKEIKHLLLITQRKVTPGTPPTELFQNLSRFRRESTFPLLEICIEDPRVD